MSYKKQLLLEVKNLNFKYDNKIVLEGLNFKLEDKECIWIQGINGAGKSTLLKILSGIIKMDVNISFRGDKVQDINIYKKEIAYIPDYPMLYDFLTGKENLELIMNLWQIKKTSDYLERAYFLAEKFHLKDDLFKSVHQYSLGMKHKLFFISMFARNPNILFLDEPFSAWDQQSYSIAVALLKDYINEGNSIIYISHLKYLQDDLATKVLLLEDKRLKEINK